MPYVGHSRDIYLSIHNKYRIPSCGGGVTIHLSTGREYLIWEGTAEISIDIFIQISIYLSTNRESFLCVAMGTAEIHIYLSIRLSADHARIVAGRRCWKLMFEGWCWKASASTRCGMSCQ